MNFWEWLKNLLGGKKAEVPAPAPAKPEAPKVEVPKKEEPKKPVVVPEAPKPAPAKNLLAQIVEFQIAESKKNLKVYESKGFNRSPEIDAWNKASGVDLGSPYCMAFTQYMLRATEKKFGIKSRVVKSAHCWTVWQSSPKELRLSKPVPGCLIIWNYVGSTNGHVGQVMEVLPGNKVRTIEANTGPDDNSIERNGDGVYIKIRPLERVGKMQILGYLAPWDDMIEKKG